MVLRLQQGLDYDLELTNTGSGVLLRGTASISAISECSRCLEEAKLELVGEVEGYFIIKVRDEELSLADDEFSLVPPDGVVDLAPNIIAAIVYEIPQVILCQEDCRGLCPLCGINLNTQSCNCSNGLPVDSPFAVLKNLV